MRIDDYTPTITVLKELGTRSKDLRVSKNMSQEDLAEKAGVSRSSVRRFENGNDVSISSIISILRVLGILSNIELLIPQYETSPIDIIDNKKKKQRAYPKSVKTNDWVWGEDKKEK